MAKSNSIETQLPYLRRYARCLTGRQASADAYVEAVLETLLADPSSIPRGMDLRVGLYRVFSRVWNSVGGNLVATPVIASRAQDVVDRRIEMLTPVARQAFLLASVEGFEPREVAVILDKPVEAIHQDIERAGREIAAEIATSVLIIEDEPMIALDLEALATSLGHTVIGVARTRSEAIEMVASRRPGLILSDIRLADGSSGLDAVRDILEGRSIPVIFITAYPEEVLTGLRPEPTFLISKPFMPDVVRTVISQALFFEVEAKLGREARAGAEEEPAGEQRVSVVPATAALRTTGTARLH